MKRIIYFSLLILSSVLIFNSCAKDSEDSIRGISNSNSPSLESDDVFSNIPEGTSELPPSGGEGYDEYDLMRIGARGKDIPANQLPNSNFVFLIDVSGSMNRPDKIELLKQSFIEFVEFLPADDRIAIVTYSGSSNVILNSTPVSQASTIINAIESLQTGGGTNGAEGIITAYEIAEANFIEGGNNRLIVGTDGDFNIGVSSSEGLVELIEEKREGGV